MGIALVRDDIESCDIMPPEGGAVEEGAPEDMLPGDMLPEDMPPELVWLSDWAKPAPPSARLAARAATAVKVIFI